MEPEPISTAFFANASHQSIYLYVNLLIVARQRLGQNVTAASNSLATTEGLLNALFYMRSFSCQKKVGD
jgi:hypothetical protein